MRFSLCSLPTANPSMAPGSNSLMWFRKGIRIHDNPALEYAAKGSEFVYPVFVIDPHYMEPDQYAFSSGSRRAGSNRIRFLLESLADLDLNLKKIGSRLLVLKGEPSEVLKRCLQEWRINKLCFEFDTEPYYQALDEKVKNYASTVGVEIFSPVSHTIFNPADIIQKNGGTPPLSYQSFVKLAGKPSFASSPVSVELTCLPPVGSIGNCPISEVPSMKELGYKDEEEDERSPFRGGESEALKRLRESIANKDWVADFEKPKGDPSSFLKPATTVLSPYLKVTYSAFKFCSLYSFLFRVSNLFHSPNVGKFGCLSSRYFYQCIVEIQKDVGKHTSPPVSLLGQLLWREFFYTVALGTPNFDQMRNNKICKQIPWKNDDGLLIAWRDATTGFPWIDAIMVQYSFGSGVGCTILLGTVLHVS